MIGVSQAKGSQQEDRSEELLSSRANMTVGNRALGGRLHVTTVGVLFRPHWFDRLTGGKEWQIDLGEITGVHVADRGSNPFDGSVRRRLVIETSHQNEYFVVPNAAKAGATIESLLARDDRSRER
jgi:hypothetical protein